VVGTDVVFLPPIAHHLVGIALAYYCRMQQTSPNLRYLCSELVLIVREDETTDCRKVVGNLEEIAEDNVVVLTDTLLPHGARVRIRCRSHEMKGIVDSSTHQQPLGFFAVVQLQPESRWSENHFAPEHMLAPWKLAEAAAERYKSQDAA
jgi:hypothetical protein